MKKLIHSILCRLTYAFAPLRRRIINMSYNVQLGKGTIVEPDVLIRPQFGGSLIIGENCHLSKGAQLITNGGDICIGDNSTVNPYTIIYGSWGGVKIGNGVRIAAHCVIVPSNHIYDNPDEYIYKQGMSCKGIIIEDDVWIGSGVKILDGVTVKKGCVIGANAVVTKTTESYGVYVGVPATKIKTRLRQV